MGNEFAWFFDVATIAIIVACTYLGAKKGFLRAITLLLGYLIAISCGFFIGKVTSPVIYDNCLKTRIEKSVEENLDSFSIKDQIKDLINDQDLGVEIPEDDIDKIINQSSNLTEDFTDYVVQTGATVEKSEVKDKFADIFNNNAVLEKIKGKIPESMYLQVEEYLDNSKQSLTNIVKALNNPSKEESAKEITELIVEPLVITIIEIIVMIISFAILMIIVRLISRSLSKFNKVPVLGPVNFVLGGFLGLIQGVIIVFIIMLVIKLIISFTSNDLMVFNTPTIENTKIFKEIYNFKLIK